MKGSKSGEKIHYSVLVGFVVVMTVLLVVDELLEDSRFDPTWEGIKNILLIGCIVVTALIPYWPRRRR